ncbi:MAG: YbjN domain-containing protein [Microthrixaceae bacterium]
MTTEDLPPSTPEQLEALDALIEGWLAQQLAENPAVASIERDTESGERRWVARVEGEEKAISAVWFHLRQRTLHVETYMMPAPEENQGQLYEHLLRRNLRLHGFSFSIGAEDGIFLIGEVPNAWVTTAELDRLLGSVYVYVEQCFRPAMRIGYATRFQG